VGFEYEGFRSLQVCLGFFLCVGLVVPVCLGGTLRFFLKKKKLLLPIKNK
jgi:hypothetical protein